MKPVPTYRELERPDDTGLPLAWGIWGPDDQLGTLNNITEAKVREAARLVKRGVRFNLDLPLHVPYGEVKENAHVKRRAPVQTLLVRDREHLLVRDDKLDEFYLQCSSQWDGLTHMGDPRHGFYNGVSAEQVTQREGTRNGIEHLAEFGVVSRGVLADIPRYYARKGRDWDIMAQQVVTAEDLAACLADQKSELEPGDVLMVRLGWVEAFRAAPDVEARDALLRPWKFSGLSGQEDMWEFLWDQRVAALASDSVTVEVWPIDPPRPSLHLSIARLGLTLGEMFDFEALAADCAEQGDYRAMFTSSPLNVRGGVGSPPNAMAIR
ncbi:MAG: cyclase family protein [SAR324 cluster bacterium]|nr:cyclase family protein [SAR324 cluster bacterium]